MCDSADDVANDILASEEVAADKDDIIEMKKEMKNKNMNYDNIICADYEAFVKNSDGVNIVH